MRIELFAFQKLAIEELRMKTAMALGAFRMTSTPQVVSFTAPTGAGKTVMMKVLIESILRGDERFPEQNDAVFVWLSDSPQLNKQSLDKIALNSSIIGFGDCVMIEEESFDMEILEDGKVYFLNTQKLGKKSKLVRQGDDRTYTIWQTIKNTVEQKNDRLYFIIDEAHRGMQGTDAGRATTIMQKFIKGSPDDGLPPMPVVIGISATPERFDALVRGTSSSIHKCIVPPSDVRESGLLKERIVLTYPSEDEDNRDISILRAAAEDWRDKWDRWKQYCQEQHSRQVNPILIVQVLNGTGGKDTDTDLYECLQTIQQHSGFKFKAGEVVHTFGGTSSSLKMEDGLEVWYVEPSQIASDDAVRVVFFKENLSTGWDCPRAETMMSFRRAEDATYIAQLLGRMVRTPLHRKILVDDVLNNVHLFLPHFNADTVNEIVDALQSEEEGQIPTIVDAEPLGNPNTETWGVKPQKPVAQDVSAPLFAQTNTPASQTPTAQTTQTQTEQTQVSQTPTAHKIETLPPIVNVTPSQQKSDGTTDAAGNEATIRISEPANTEEPIATAPKTKEIDRAAIVRFINETGLLTYKIKTKRVSNYLVSLFRLTHLLTRSGLYSAAVKDVNREIVAKIRAYIDKLKEQGRYDDVMDQVRQFKLTTQTFDLFAEAADATNVKTDLFSAADYDIDREFRATDRLFANEGLGYEYGKIYSDVDDPTTFKVEFIAFATNDECITMIHRFAEDKFHELRDEYRRKFCASNRTDEERRAFDSIASNGDEISEHNFMLPETISVQCEHAGTEYSSHLFVREDTGKAKIKLDSWEAALIKEEEQRPDFICWIRNQVKKGLCIPYTINGETHGTYPDFIIIRKDENTEYVIDILEPHNPSLKDNLGKAQGFARYAQKNPSIGRIQLIRKGTSYVEKEKFKRLDMSKESIRDKVIKATSNDQIDNYFDEYGFIEE